MWTFVPDDDFRIHWKFDVWGHNKSIILWLYVSATRDGRHGYRNVVYELCFSLYGQCIRVNRPRDQFAEFRSPVWEALHEEVVSQLETAISPKHSNSGRRIKPTHSAVEVCRTINLTVDDFRDACSSNKGFVRLPNSASRVVNRVWKIGRII